ncbi:MAG: uracil-DNA glycosylase [Hyphomicrobiales bacterium]|nr:uracil-DNA glycosylase [Hyphomicrobiales bacterium]MDE2017694.1 uracil-DNA glycosylase [Hyphomicrobiales bacterium]
MTFREPGRDCPGCPRLAEYRRDNRAAEPAWHNAPVPGFGDRDARLLVVGLAPGRGGANRTGRPFTGDHAGVLLYETLAAFGFSRGTFAADPSDGLTLVDARIANAVRCAPPQNKPTPAEIAACGDYLSRDVAAMPRLVAAIALGKIAHDATLRALGEVPSRRKFAHGARHDVGRLAVFDSYHCSRYNTNTGVLTTPMFRAVFAGVRAYLDARPA